MLSFLLFSRESNKRSVYIKRTIFYMTLFVKKSISIGGTLIGEFKNAVKREHHVCQVKRKWAKPKPIYVNPQSSCFASGNPYTNRKSKDKRI